MVSAPVVKPDPSLVRSISKAQGEPDWLLERRLAAWEVFERLEMPKRSEETWRRTDLRGLDPVSFTSFGANGASASDSPASLVPAGVTQGNLLQTDWRTAGGWLAPELQEKGVVFCDLPSALRSHGDLIREHLLPAAAPTSLAKFEALHKALWSGGAFLYVPDNIEISMPLHNFLWMTGGGRANFAHTTIVIGDGSRLELVEEQGSRTADDQAFSTTMVDIVVGKGSRLDYVAIQNWGLHHVGFSNLRAVVGRDAILNLVEFALGGALTKTVVQAVFPEPGSESEIWGLYLPNGRQHFDHETHQHHIADHTRSNLMYKGVLHDRSRSVYYGMITIEDSAGQSFSYQANHNLLLSNLARADSVPKMEIKTNDVRCKHGAAVGRLDEDEVYYLRTRGFSRKEAERLIVRGFLQPVLQRVVSDSLRDSLEQVVLERAKL